MKIVVAVQSGNSEVLGEGGLEIIRAREIDRTSV